MNSTKPNFKKAFIWFAVFAVFTLLVKFVDVQPVGDTGTSIGFAFINVPFFDALGYSTLMYKITQACGLIGLAIAFCAAMSGLDQLIKRKSLHFVDPGIIAMGIYYVIVIAFYVLFMFVAVNYRPVYVNSAELESSYPSSHTMLALTVVVALMKYTRGFEKEKPFARKFYTVLCWAFIAVSVVGRFFSGVHWFTDIAGGIILSIAIIETYDPLRAWVQSIHDGKETARLEKQSR